MPIDLAALPEAEREALWVCAAARWFDAAVLEAALERPGQGAALLTRLVTQPYVERLPAAPDRYALEPTVQRALQTELRHDQPARYRALHRRLFDHCVDRLASASDAEQAVDEDALVYHLEELFSLLMSAYELTELAEVLQQAEAVRLRQAAHRHWLTYYQGCLSNERGDYAAAATAYTGLLRATDLADDLRARTLTALGMNYDYRGQFDLALEAYAESRALYARLGDTAREGIALKNMGIIYHQLADFEQAQSLFAASLRLFQQAGRLVSEAGALMELGYTAKELGRWEDALHYYQVALDIWRRLETRERQGRIHNNLGEVYHLIGRLDDAQAHYEQALAIALDPRHANKREAADMLLNLGFLFCAQRRWDAARQRYDQALALARDINSPTAISQALYRLGDLAQRQGEVDQALAAYQQAVETVEAMRGRVERQEVKISLLGARQQLYEALVLLCWQQRRFAEAFHSVERARAQAFLDLLAQRAPASADTDSPPPDPTEPVLGLVDVQRGLPPDTAIVAYFTTGVLDWGEGIVQNLPPATKGLKEYLVPPAHTLAFVVTQTGLACHALRLSPNALRPGPTDPPGADRFLDPTRLRRLYDALIAPLEADLAGLRTLYLIPHGPLNSVPFQALVRPDGQPLLRADGPELAYAPSATVWLRYCRPRASRASEPCLALGYNGAGPTPLHHAEDEAQAIARLWRGQAHVGPQPKKAVLYAGQARYRRLHLSCHGQFTPHDPLASYLALAEGERLTAAEILEGLRLEAELVTLSACESGVSRVARGDELLGLVRAFISAGAPSLVVTQWKVEEVSTRIAMQRFHQNLAAGQGKAAALHDAQLYLRDLSLAELRAVLTGYGHTEAEVEAQVSRLARSEPRRGEADDDTRVFAHPHFWAPFILVGNYH